MNKVKRNTDIRKFGWNMIGSMSNALASFVLLTMVTRMNGSSDGGIFSLAFSTAQMLTSIGCFETRAIQVTDAKRKLEFKDYFTFRFVTSIIMMLCLVVYVVFSKKSDEAASLCFLFAYIKQWIACRILFRDYFSWKIGSICREWHWESGSFSVQFLEFRLLGLFHDLVFSAITMCIVELIFIFFFDYRLSKRYEKCKLRESTLGKNGKNYSVRVFHYLLEVLCLPHIWLMHRSMQLMQICRMKFRIIMDFC